MFDCLHEHYSEISKIVHVHQLKVFDGSRLLTPPEQWEEMRVESNSFIVDCVLKIVSIERVL